jgi:hypothetical protein
MRGQCRVYISEPNSEASNCRSTEESREWEYNGGQRSTTENTRMRIEVSRRRSEFRESAVEGMRLCQEDLVCHFTCAVVQ